MKTVHERYAQAKNKLEKGVILDEFCKTYDCHRKHALRTLNGPAPGARRAARMPRQSLDARRELPFDLLGVDSDNGSEFINDHFDTQAAVDAINDLYRHELRWFQNLFLPSMKLIGKVRIGSKLRRRYDKPKTPFQRVLDSGRGDPVKVAALRRLRDQLKPGYLPTFHKKPLQGEPQMPAPWPAIERFARLKTKETALRTW